MSSFKVHIIHVGNMANKGTQALFTSDVFLINEILEGNVSISVSTTDVEGVRRLKLPLYKVTPPLLDIPYERADFYARVIKFNRKSLRYKICVLSSFFLMFVQMALSLFSIFLLKLGLKPLYRADTLNCIKECDLVISCSDENFKETASMLPFNIYWALTWWSMLAARTFEIFGAKLLAKPAVMFPNSIGPFRTFIGRLLAIIALNNFSVILVREPISFNRLNSVKVRALKILTNDTALLLSTFYEAGANEKLGSTIGVSPGIYSFAVPWEKIQNYITVHAKALDDAIEKHGVSVIFLPHYVTGLGLDDLEICRLIVSSMKHAAKTKIVYAKNVEEFKDWINRVEMVISSKMHPAVIAASVNVPFLFIAYDHKQTGFALSLGLDDCVLPINELSYENFLSKIEYVWGNLDKIKSMLVKNVLELQKNVKASISLAVKPFAKKKMKGGACHY